MEILTEQLICDFNLAETKIKEFFPKGNLHLMAAVHRNGGNLELSYTIGSLSTYPDDSVKGKVLAEVIKEYLRRKGYEMKQKEILLEPPAIEPAPLDDEIPF